MSTLTCLPPWNVEYDETIEDLDFGKAYKNTGRIFVIGFWNKRNKSTQ